MKNKIQTILKKSAYWMSIIAFGTMLGVFLQFAKAWSEPTAAPPDGNVGAPINTGSVAQTKNGNLNVYNGYLQAYGDSGYYGLLNYGGYGGYFYGSGGVFSQNTSGYYTYLNYPGSSYGVYTNGNAYIGGNTYTSDVYLYSTGRWLSQGSGATINYNDCVTLYHSENGACGGGPAMANCPNNYVAVGTTTGLRFPNACVNAQLKCCRLQ